MKNLLLLLGAGYLVYRFIIKAEPPPVPPTEPPPELPTTPEQEDEEEGLIIV